MVKPSGRGEKVETLENNVLFGVFCWLFHIVGVASDLPCIIPGISTLS
jgi:hypothetical protein